MQMDPAFLAGLLARTELFADFSRSEVAVFVPQLVLEEYGPTERIVQEGDEDDAWYVVLKGEVAVTKSGVDGAPHELALLSRGESFGEMALIDQSPRSADVSAIDEVTVVKLTREAFMGIAEAGNPAATKLLWGLASVLCQRQRQLTGLLLDLVEAPEHDPELELKALALLLRTRQVERDTDSLSLAD